MVKSKQPNLVPATTKRKNSSVDAESSLLIEDDWVLVKKQKISIIVPLPSPDSKQVILPNAVDTDPKLKLVAVNDRLANPKATVQDQMHSSIEKHMSDSSIPKRIRGDDSRVRPQPNPACLNQLVPYNNRSVSGNPYVGNSRDRWLIRSCNSASVISRVAISADRNSIVNQRMRTRMIKKRLEQVGGLSKWLISLGLDRFIKTFRCKGIDMYHLARLTTGKLKEMGVYTVGPRRKLLHAIDRLCQPYC